jgi:hypothetical protein
MTRRALLIGVNAYPNLGAQYQLYGCVNDVRAMASILGGNFGFAEQDVEIVLDEHATREGITSAMQRLVERTVADDVVVIQYSGHGSQARAGGTEEGDLLNETIVPHDSGRGSGANRDITDDEIFAWLRTLTEKTRYVTLVFDCCHSGTVTRDAFGTRGRWVEPGDRPAEAPAQAVRGRDLGPSGWLPRGEGYVLLAGCRDDEVSNEHRIVREDPGQQQGALTYFLAQELVRADTGTSYRDVFERASARVTAAYPRQHPQLEGARDRELFGIMDVEPLRFVSVTGRTDGNVTLAAGAAHGVVLGSRWDVHAGNGTVAEAAEPVGVLRVETVRAVESEASIEEGRSEDVGPGARAVERSRPLGTERLVVQVQAPDEHADVAGELRGRLEGSLLLHLENGGVASICVYVIVAREQPGPQDPVPQLGPLPEPVIAAVGADGRLAMPVHPVGEPDVVSTVVGNMETLARYRRALALSNPSPDSVLRGKVELILQRRAGDGAWTPAEPEEDGGPVVFAEGDRIAVAIANRDTQPVYVSVLDFGLTGRIGLIHPPSGPSEKVEPGVTVDVGIREGEELVLSFPEDYPFALEPDEAEPSGGLETFKLFAATGGPVDFEPLLQEGVRGGLEGPEDQPLGAVVAEALTGHGTRDVTSQPSRPPPDRDWTAVDRPFLLVRGG